MAAFWKKRPDPVYVTREDLASFRDAGHRAIGEMRAEIAGLHTEVDQLLRLDSEKADVIAGLRAEIDSLNLMKLKIDADGSAPSLPHIQGQIQSQSAEIARLAGRYENVSDRVDLLSPRVELCEDKLGLSASDDEDLFGDDDEEDEEDFEDDDDDLIDDDDDDEEDDFDEFDDEFDEEEDDDIGGEDEEDDGSPLAGYFPPNVIAEIREHQRLLDEEADAGDGEQTTGEHSPVIDVTGEVIVNGMRDMGWDATGKDGGQ
jgi:hypothetical protein